MPNNLWSEERELFHSRSLQIKILSSVVKLLNGQEVLQ